MTPDHDPRLVEAARRWTITMRVTMVIAALLLFIAELLARRWDWIG